MPSKKTAFGFGSQRDRFPSKAATLGPGHYKPQPQKLWKKPQGQHKLVHDKGRFYKRINNPNGPGDYDPKPMYAQKYASTATAPAPVFKLTAPKKKGEKEEKTWECRGTHSFLSSSGRFQYSGEKKFARNKVRERLKTAEMRGPPTWRKADIKKATSRVRSAPPTAHGRVGKDEEPLDTAVNQTEDAGKEDTGKEHLEGDRKKKKVPKSPPEPIEGEDLGPCEYADRFNSPIAKGGNVVEGNGFRSMFVSEAARIQKPFIVDTPGPKYNPPTAGPRAVTSHPSDRDRANRVFFAGTHNTRRVGPVLGNARLKHVGPGSYNQNHHTISGSTSGTQGPFKSRRNRFQIDWQSSRHTNDVLGPGSHTPFKMVTF
jgi:hypothetical protein